MYIIVIGYSIELYTCILYNIIIIMFISILCINKNERTKYNE